MVEVATLLTLHASLPAPRQPAWGLGAGQDAAKRAHDERVEAIRPLLEALPREGVLRILDVECAQGYFTLAIAHALAAGSRAVEVVGVDRREENIKFCEALAAHHGIPARFVCAVVDEEFAERQDGARWDAVLAFGGSMMAADVEEEETSAVVSLLRAHARVTLCEVPDDRGPAGPDAGPNGPRDRLLANHAFSRRLASFAQLPGGAASSLYACSDHLAWLGDRWFAFDRVIDRSHAGVPDLFAGQRRFFLGAHVVLKAFRGDGRYGSFNRAELAAEAEALQALNGEAGRYPAVLAQADDGDVVWLARESLPGALLSERMASGGIDRDVVARGLLGELARLESRGFHHADLRCWNVLLDRDEVRLIDFGALVRIPSTLQRLALCAVLLEIAHGETGHEQPFYASVQPVEAYPAAWQPLVRYLLGTPQSEFRYEEAQRILESSLGGIPNRDPVTGTEMKLDDELLSSATREHCEAFERLRKHGEALERALAGEQRARSAELAEVTALRGRVKELERAQRTAEQAHAEYTASLKAELATSHDYAKSMEARLAREVADASAERDALEAAQRAAVDYSDSLNQSLNRSRNYASSLDDALRKSQAYASSLEARIQREAADAQAEREALQASQRESADYVGSLERQLDESRTCADALKASLEESQAYASSLEARVTRESADAVAEREAVRAAQGEAAAHADALKASLEESQAYASSLQVRLERESADAAIEREAARAAQRAAAAHAESLQREIDSAHGESAALRQALAAEQRNLARMRRRFRLLKWLWPHETNDSKDPE